MAFGIGVAPTTLTSSQGGSFSASFRFPPSKHPPDKTDTASRSFSSTLDQAKLSRHQRLLSSRVLIATNRARSDSSPVSAVRKDSLCQRPDSSPVTSVKTSPTSPLGFVPSQRPGSDHSRPKHIPIVIPDYETINTFTLESSRSGSFSSWLSSDNESLTASEFLASIGKRSSDSSSHKARHVEIKIPSFAQPVLKHSFRPNPRISLTHSFPETTPNSIDEKRAASAPTSPDPRHSDATESKTPVMAYANAKAANGASYLPHANSSQTSLASQQDGYDSTSEAESSHEDDVASSNAQSQPSAPPQTAQAQRTSNPPASNPSNLSGLVCNVHRTTGKEPHPLVGATTTVLGDKLYVFGGRRLSRSKPQLTSNLYELDLIKRHWTKLDVTGDIPPPRYFHSVCALGDTKLVCYGGMSPSPAAGEASGDAPPEVIVMSDVHIYDVPTKTWMKINTADAPQGRYAHCAAILPSSAVFASANAPLAAVQHNPSGNNPNQGSIGVSLDGTGGAEMVVVGGQDSANHYIEQVSVFNLRSLKWTGTTAMGRSCGAYRSVVTPLTTMSASQIGAGPHARNELDEDDDEPTTIGSGAPMLIYSNYNFLDVKLELQVRLLDGSLTEKTMQTSVSPPGLRFPNGGVIANHFVVSGTFLTSSKQEYALWALDLRTLSWSRIDAGGSIFSQGSWNRGVLWSRRNAFVILGNRKRSLVDDYNNRRINFSNICLVELEAFGLYDNPRRVAPMSAYMSASAPQQSKESDVSAVGRTLSPAAEDLGALSMNVQELSDMDFLAIDGTRIPVSSRTISRRWGPHFTSLLRESLAMSNETDTATLRPSLTGNPSRNSSITITPSVTSTSTTVTANSATEGFDAKSAPPMTRPRLFYLPHTAPTLQALLHYLYTSTLPAPPHPLATPQIFCSLLQLARPYRIDGLLEAVVERLHESLDGRNAAAIFNAAAMGAGGGEGVQFAPMSASSVRDSTIPIRGASLAGFDSGINGAGATAGRAGSALRIDTDMANGRSTRNTLRPGQPVSEESEDEMPDSAHTDASMSDFESSSHGRGGGSSREAWSGSMSAVVGLQKRGLRGLMEGRRMRERGKSDAQQPEGRVGLGIA